MAEPSALGPTAGAQLSVSPSTGAPQNYQRFPDILHPNIGTVLKVGQASSHSITAVSAWLRFYVICPMAPGRKLRLREAEEVFLVTELCAARSVLQSKHAS